VFSVLAGRAHFSPHALNSDSSDPDDRKGLVDARLLRPYRKIGPPVTLCTFSLRREATNSRVSKIAERRAAIDKRRAAMDRFSHFHGTGRPLFALLAEA
jgi:hypothetical protein